MLGACCTLNNCASCSHYFIESSGFDFREFGETIYTIEKMAWSTIGAALVSSKFSMEAIDDFGVGKTNFNDTLGSINGAAHFVAFHRGEIPTCSLMFSIVVL